MTERGSYHTRHEIEFLKNIGNYREQWKRKLTQLDLLKNYLKAMDLRKDWGNIDKKEVKTFVKNFIYVLSNEYVDKKGRKRKYNKG